MSDASESTTPTPDELDPAVGLARPVSWEAVRPAPDDPMLLASISRGDAGIDLLLLLAAVAVAIGAEVVVSLVIPVLSGIPLPPPGGEPSPELIRAVLLPGMATRTILLTVAVLLITRWRQLSPASVGVTWRWFGLDLLIGVASIVVLAVLMLGGALLLQLLWPEFVRQMQENTGRLSQMLPRMSPAAIIVLMSLVAWWEELVFRGFVMTRVRRLFGNWTAAVVVNGLLFVLPHMLEQTPVAMLAVGVLAIAFSLLTIWRRSLVPAIVGHLLFNLSQFFLLYYVHFPASEQV